MGVRRFSYCQLARADRVKVGLGAIWSRRIEGLSKMDRVTLTDAIKAGPVQVFMSDGSRFVIQSPEFAIVDDIAAHVLTTEADGKMRARILALVCMTRVEPLVSAQ